MNHKEAIKFLEELNTLYANGRLGYYKDFVNKTKEVIELMINGKKYSIKEKKRRYVFVGKDIELENVTEIIVSSSNNHRLKTADGRLHIIPPTWIHIEIDSEEDWIF